MRWKKLWKWFKITLVIYILAGIGLYFFQDALLFHPVTLKREEPYNFPQPHTEINIPINAESNLNIIRFLSRDSINKGVVLYFHGNRKNISWYAKYSPYFTKHDYEVWLIDYPGFGKSTGKFNEQTLYDWALQLYKLAEGRFPDSNIIIYGKSMGTGIAAQLASVKDCRRLILETPFYDFPSVIQHYLPIYPVRRMLHYEIPTYHYLQNVKAPVTIFQGTDDAVITYSNAERLKPFLKNGDEFVTIKKGSHNDLFTFKETIRKLDSLLTY